MPAVQQTIAPTAFGATSTTDDVLTGVNLRGKRVLVTGVSAGLGVETARALVAHGADVVGAVRDLSKAKAATAGVQAAAEKGGGLELVELDLASLHSVRACADALVDDGKPFDLVIANAGVMACPFGKTADGFETQFGANHLGQKGSRLATSASAQARTLASDAKSSSTSSRLPPLAASARTFARLRAAPTTSAPCAASARAVSTPRPADTPVTSTRLPLRLTPSSTSSVVDSAPKVLDMGYLQVQEAKMGRFGAAENCQGREAGINGGCLRSIYGGTLRLARGHAKFERRRHEPLPSRGRREGAGRSA
jgi:hypothetical protein